MANERAPLVRRGRVNARYTAIPNEIIDHPTLTPEARIVLIYLLSKPENWELRISDLRRLLGAGGNICGRNKTYEVLKELKDCAHVVAVKQLEGGRFVGVAYYVFDEPHPDPEAFKRGNRRHRGPSEIGPDECRATPSGTGLSPRPEKRDTAPPPCPKKREPVRPPYPEKRDPGIGHSNNNRRVQNTDSPPTPPAYAGHKRRGDEGDFEFLELWNLWPEEERPRQRSYAERLFGRLEPDERQAAIQHARSFRIIRAGQGCFAPMINYLSDRLFREFDAGPEIDRQGYFVIRPDRDEWPLWLAHYRERYGKNAIAHATATGLLLTRTRWPGSNMQWSKPPSGMARHRDRVLASPDVYQSSTRERRSAGYQGRFSELIAAAKTGRDPYSGFADRAQAIESVSCSTVPARPQ